MRLTKKSLQRVASLYKRLNCNGAISKPHIVAHLFRRWGVLVSDFYAAYDSIPCMPFTPRGPLPEVRNAANPIVN
jgi:hypothetical protein